MKRNDIDCEIRAAFFHGRRPFSLTGNKQDYNKQLHLLGRDCRRQDMCAFKRN